MKNQSTNRDIQRVSLVTLETKEEKVELQKEETIWKVNGENEVRTDAIRMLLETLSRISIKSTVSESLFQNDWKEDSASVIRIKIKENPGGLKSYLVYPVNSNPYGNYFKKREGGTAYIVNIPGYSGDVGSLFITHEKYWLPHLVYTYQPSEIREVKMIVFSNDEQSFKILQDSLGSIRFLSYPAEKPVESMDTLKVLRYLSYFINLRFERWAFDLDSVNRNDILSSQPLHELSVTDKFGKTVHLTTYPIIRKTGDNEADIDLNRIYARMNNESDLVVIKYVDIDPILKVRSYFIEKPEE